MPYRTVEKKDHPPVLCPQCGSPVRHEWLYMGGERKIKWAWCDKACGWRWK
jgi:hypothetical protein